MSQEQLKKSFEKITDTMKVLTQDFENIGKLFEGMYQRDLFTQIYISSTYITKLKFINLSAVYVL